MNKNEKFGGENCHVEKTLKQLALELAELDPRPVTYFTPDNLDEVMEDFLNGKCRNPDHAKYSKLDELDFSAREDQYLAIIEEILSRQDIPTSHHRAYKEFADRSLKINELMHQAVLFRTAENDSERDVAKHDFMELNSELYGYPDNEVATSMVKELMADISSTNNEKIIKTSEEFVNLLPRNLVNMTSEVNRLQPSDEDRLFVRRCIENIYHPLLSRANETIDDIKSKNNSGESYNFNSNDIAVVFEKIINFEFADSGWKVVLKSANAINVVNSEKTVVVPENRAPVSANKLRGLVVHELGVHMLRSIIGEKSDLIPLRFGLANVGEAEEGLAKVMESELSDDAQRTGYQHYLTAALLHNGYDFRDAFEVMWRYKMLDAYLDKPDQEIDNKFIEGQRKTTFKFMFRSIRGTNELPWFATLNYFNGTNKIWKYIENHREDPDIITLMFMGKIDPTNISHLNSALDAKSKVS